MTTIVPATELVESNAQTANVQNAKIRQMIQMKKTKMRSDSKS